MTIDGTSGVSNVSNSVVSGDGTTDPGFISDDPVVDNTSTATDSVISSTTVASAVGDAQPVVVDDSTEETSVDSDSSFQVKLEEDIPEPAYTYKVFSGGKEDRTYSTKWTGKLSKDELSDFEKADSENSKLVFDSGKQAGKVMTLSDVSKTGDQEAIDNFKRIDLNGDGKLSYAEIITESRRPARETFSTNNSNLINKDGSIMTEAEANAAGLGTEFDALDTNLDGNISFSEIEAANNTYEGNKFALNNAELLNSDGELMSKSEADAAGVGDKFDSIDSDGDGLISSDEINEANKSSDGAFVSENSELIKSDGSIMNKSEADAAGVGDKFDSIDTDGDGMISTSEVAAVNASSSSSTTVTENDKFAIINPTLLNTDGSIMDKDQAEAAGFGAEFDAIDTDGDGILSNEEIAAANQTDSLVKSDGTVMSQKEADSVGLTDKYNSIDTDGDGSISSDEIISANQNSTSI